MEMKGICLFIFLLLFVCIIFACVKHRDITKAIAKTEKINEQAKKTRRKPLGKQSPQAMKTLWLIRKADMYI